MTHTKQGSRNTCGTTAEDLLNSIRDGYWWKVKRSEPHHIAAPVPSRGQASFADILDNNWELWRGGVRLADTKQTAVQHELPVSNDSLDIRLLCAHLRVADQDEDNLYATWPPQSSLLQGSNTSRSGDMASAQGPGLGLGSTGAGDMQSCVIEQCGVEHGFNTMQCDCRICATVSLNARIFNCMFIFTSWR